MKWAEAFVLRADCLKQFQEFKERLHAFTPLHRF